MTTGILSPRPSSFTTYVNHRPTSSVGSPTRTPSKTYARQELIEDNHSDSQSPTPPQLVTKKVIGINFRNELDAEAYVSRIALEPRFKAVIVSEMPGSNHAFHPPVDLLLTDRCLRAGQTSVGQATAANSANSLSINRVIRIQKDLSAPCNCCRTLASSAGWKELLMLVGSALGLAPITSSNSKTLISIDGAPRQSTRKLTPAARRGLPEELDALTRREIDILQLVGRGMSVRAMANELKLAESTIGNHKYRLMRKLDVTSSLGLLRIAVRCGLSEL